jgi:hypothetical protein
MEMETWKHEDGDRETWRHGYRDIKQKMENGSQAIFLSLFTVCSTFNQKYVVSLFVDKTQTELSICIWTKRTCPTKLLLILTQLCIGIPKVYCCMQSVVFKHL